jgi:hypothetical protein
MLYIRLFGSLLHIWTYEKRAMEVLKALATAAFTSCSFLGTVSVFMW